MFNLVQTVFGNAIVIKQQLVGTSLLMIEKHYSHLVSEAARLRLANVEML
jgi:hypothetical protein